MKELKGYMHGINLGGWLSQCAAYSEEHYNSFIREHCKDCHLCGSTVTAVSRRSPLTESVCRNFFCCFYEIGIEKSQEVY